MCWLLICFAMQNKITIGVRKGDREYRHAVQVLGYN